MNRLMFFLCYLILCLSTEAQNQFEFSICHTFSPTRIYKTVKSDQGASIHGGGAFDPNRNSFIFNINQSLGKKSFGTYGICYAVNSYYFRNEKILSQGKSENNEIFQKYQSIAPFVGLKTHWGNEKVRFFIGLNVFPEFVLSQKGYYDINQNYEEIKGAKTGLSHLNSRINLSIQFGNNPKGYFTFNWFIQPPGLYLTSIIKERITYVNTGFGLGWTFNLPPKSTNKVE